MTTDTTIPYSAASGPALSWADPAIDDSAFAALMALAGPQLVPELLAQMRIDLLDIALSLTQALHPLAPQVLQSRSHVLCALAGSTGAQALHSAAISLNHIAQTGDEAQISRQAIPVLAGLYGLIHYIDHQSAASV